MRLSLPRPSLTTNAFSLMTATIVTNAFGLVFWAEAARLKSPTVVGRAAATVAALTLLAAISQLNLTNVFVRLLPAAGRLGRGLILRGYLAVFVFAAVLGGIFVVSGVDSSVVSAHWGGRVLFALAVPLLAIFALQDSVLTALRLTRWVPIENVAFAVSKVALLAVLVLLPWSGAIVIAWVVPASIAVFVVSWLLLKYALPKLASIDGTLPTRRRMMSFVAGEYAGSIFATATVQLMPLIVIWKLGAAAAAYFTLPWLISMGITLLLWNVASSFVVEIVGGHGQSQALLRRSLMLWAGIVIGTLVVCLLGAGPVLALAGSGYAAHGTKLLRLIGLSAPFSAITAVYCTLVWLDQRVWALAVFQAVIGLALVGGSLVLLPHLGLVAVGWVNLVVQGTAGLAAAMLIAARVHHGGLVPAT
jgi:O-antigen/teichoic acid export membrane protein